MKAKDQNNDDSKVLTIGHGAGKWKFDLRGHLLTILVANKDKDAFVIGYPSEEMPVIPSIHPTAHIEVPHFTIHLVPRNAPPPSRFAVQDLQRCTCEYHSIEDLPLQWETVAISPTWQKVQMLVSTSCSTRASRSATRHATCTGAQLWFPIVLDTKANPAEAFAVVIEGETYSFVDEMVDIARLGVRKELAESGDKWDDFSRWGIDAWVLVYLRHAVNAFFEYEDDLDRGQYEQLVATELARTMTAYKNNFDDEQRRYEEHAWYKDDLKHYVS